MKKWSWIGGICLVVIVAAVLFWRLRPAETVAPAAAPEPTAVAKGDIFQAVACSGRVTASLDSDIRSKAGGVVLKLPFDVSDTVKQGDLLVEIDPIDSQRAVQKAQAAVDGSVAKLAEAKQNVLVAEQNLVVARLQSQATLEAATAKAEDARTRYQSRKELADQKLLAPEDVLTFKTAASQAQADLNTAQAAVEAVKVQELSLELKRREVDLAQSDLDSDKVVLADNEQRLKETKVVAPFDGVVSSRTVQIGQTISSATTNVSGGTALMTLAVLSPLWIAATVDESDIGKVKEGQTVNITADAFPRAKFTGKVIRIATKGVNTSNVVTFEVRIEVTSENKRLLKPEMTTNVQIVAAEKHGVLAVPMQAVTRKQGNSYTVTVKKADGTTDERPVQVGLNDGEKMEITSGLTEGETVMVRKDDTASKWKPGGQGNRPGGAMMGGPMPGGGGGPRR